VGVVAFLLNRAKTHCSQLWDRRKEQEKVKSTLMSNGYPNNVFSKVLQECRQKAVWEKKEYRDLVVIPYVAGLSEAI
jgi:SOS response regulatory protein OraA/RecX